MTVTFELGVDAERWRRGLRALSRVDPGHRPGHQGQRLRLRPRPARRRGGRPRRRHDRRRHVRRGARRARSVRRRRHGAVAVAAVRQRPSSTTRASSTPSAGSRTSPPSPPSTPTAASLIEGETSMARHGLDRHELAAAVAALGELQVEGFAIHLPMAGHNLAEAESWAAALAASQVETTTLFVSHLTPGRARDACANDARSSTYARASAPRCGSATSAHCPYEPPCSTVTRSPAASGSATGSVPMPRDGHLLIIAGGTSHGIGLEAPKASAGAVQRGKSLAKGGLEAAGFVAVTVHDRRQAALVRRAASHAGEHGLRAGQRGRARSRRHRRGGGAVHHRHLRRRHPRLAASRYARARTIRRRSDRGSAEGSQSRHVRIRHRMPPGSQSGGGGRSAEVVRRAVGPSR